MPTPATRENTACTPQHLSWRALIVSAMLATASRPAVTAAATPVVNVFASWKTFFSRSGCLLVAATTAGIVNGATPAADTPFVQEYHEPYPIGEELAENDVRAVAVDARGDVWAATAAGI
ncbi:MAG: hypothetical protein ACC645_27720, partial [Pirellulales bacterium]